MSFTPHEKLLKQMRQVLYHSLSSKFITTGEWNVALQKFSSMLKEISTTFLACFNPFIYNVVKWPNWPNGQTVLNKSNEKEEGWRHPVMLTYRWNCHVRWQEKCVKGIVWQLQQTVCGVHEKN